MARVAILQRWIGQYRRPFYDRLRERLSRSGTGLVLVYGLPDACRSACMDTCDVEWGTKVRPWRLAVGRRELLWHPCLRELRGADLVIVEQASRMLVNYWLLAQQACGLRRVAFWGHGRNFQTSTASRPGEWVKRVASRRVHWWFAYNDLAAEAVRGIGFPQDRITVVQNSLDTSWLLEARRQKPQALPPAGPDGLPRGVKALYVGGMYEEKRIPFLLECCAELRGMLADFTVTFVGTGPGAGLVREFAERNPWARSAGPVFGAAAAPCWIEAHVLLVPGAVGLVALDSFAAEVPLVTVDDAEHGPEIGYVEDGVNGVIIAGPVSARAYAERVTALLRDRAAFLRLQSGCQTAAQRYTLDNMVENFARGVAKALAGA